MPQSVELRSDWPIVCAARPGLLQLDISDGKELCRVPVFNEVDTEQPPTRDQLEYLR